jgi:hypothetical protein
MKRLFICELISVFTEKTESEETLQIPSSKLQRSSKALKRGFDVGVLLCLPAIAVLFRNQLPAWGFMWATASAIYLGCKWVTWRRASRRMSWLRSIAYFLWCGMDPEPFLSPALPACNSQSAWIRALRNSAAGAALVFIAARLASHTQSLWVGWIGMLGVVLFLHFGAFELLAALWNKAGIRVKPVMQAPIVATSVAEFWGRRWNTAFNDLARELVFRPLVKMFEEKARRVGDGRKGSKHRSNGMAAATLVVFGGSGLIHELVISLPARGGYGLPTAYFILQGLVALFERSRFGRQIGLGRGVRGWLFTLACTAGAAFWLFHPPFVRNVILPMLHALGGN